jgi:O-succinylbenzoic acid--CoA ligase
MSEYSAAGAQVVIAAKASLCFVLIEAWLERAAALRPDAIAIETPQARITYGELHAQARAGAAVLSERGVAPGERVAIALPGGLEFAQALHATLLLGAVAVPVDLRLAADERALLLDGTSHVVQTPLTGGLAGAGAAAARHVRPEAHPQPPVSTEPRALHDLDAVAVVVHTSGTSARPKPVELTYGNLLWSALGSAVALGSDAEERWLCPLPLSHVGGLSVLMRSAIYATTAVIHERFELEPVLSALRDGGITLVSLVARTLERLLDAGLEEPRTLRCALTGGGPVARSLIARARDAAVPVSATYGLTEACSQVATAPLAALEEGARPLFCTRVRVDPVSQEIMVRGPTVAPGSSDGDGWLHTGDLGRVEGGVLRVTGRSSETIITGGENVAPEEVERALVAHPGVAEAAVFARADARWGEAVTAVVVAREGAALDSAELRAHCATRLAPYKVPKEVWLVAGPLPRTSSGKLLRRALGGAAEVGAP